MTNEISPPAEGAAALQLWETIFPQGNPKALLCISRIKGGMCKEQFFNYPNAAPAAAEHALGWAAKGWDVYFCAHLLTAAERKGKYAAPLRTAYADLDGAEIPASLPAPTAMVLSGGFVNSHAGEGVPKMHVYWTLDQEHEPRRVEALNKGIATTLGADPSGYDLSQLLRVPGTRNYKPGAGAVELATPAGELASGRVHKLEDLEAAFPHPRLRASIASEEPKPEKPAYNGKGYEGEFDLGSWLEWYGIEILSYTPDDDGGVYHIVCPWADEHTGGDTSGTRVGRAAVDGGTWFKCHHAHCDGRKYEEFKAKIAPVADVRFDGFSENGAVDHELVNSQEPSESMEFPVDAFPKAWAEYIRAAAKDVNCPPELVALPSLAAASGAIGRSRELIVKRRYTIPALLWLAVIAAPGEKKTPAQNAALLPHRTLAAEARKEHKIEMEAWGGEMREHVLAAKLARKDDQVEPPPPEKPTLRRLLVDDITIEALAGKLQDNPRGLLSAQDELAGFVNGMDQYKSGKGNARQQYLKLWSCGDITVDRKGEDEPTFVSAPFMALQGGMQPSIVNEIAGGRDDGFMDRFLFCYHARDPRGDSEYEVPEDVEDAYTGLIRSLYEAETKTIGMSAGAKDLFKHASHELAAERMTPGFPLALDGPWGKMGSQLGRLALILSCARHALEGGGEIVDEVDMQRALRLLDFFKSAARKVWGQIHAADPDDVLASDLVALLRDVGDVRDVISGNVIENDVVNEGSIKASFTISNLYYKLYGIEGEAGAVKALGQAVRRVAKKFPAITLESSRKNDERTITLTLKNNVTNVTNVTRDEEPSNHAGSAGDVSDDVSAAPERTSPAGTRVADEGERHPVQPCCHVYIRGRDETRVCLECGHRIGE